MSYACLSVLEADCIHPTERNRIKNLAIDLAEIDYRQVEVDPTGSDEESSLISDIYDDFPGVKNMYFVLDVPDEEGGEMRMVRVEDVDDRIYLWYVGQLVKMYKSRAGVDLVAEFVDLVKKGL